MPKMFSPSVPEAPTALGIEVRGYDHIQTLRHGDKTRTQRVNQLLFVLNIRILGGNLPEHVVPKDHAVIDGVGLGRAGHFLAPVPARILEGIAHNALGAMVGEDCRLHRRLLRSSLINTSANSAIFAFAVLANADDVDVRGTFTGQRASHAGQQAYGTKIDVLVKALANGQQHTPQRYVVGHTWIAHRANQDGVKTNPPPTPSVRRDASSLRGE